MGPDAECPRSEGLPVPPLHGYTTLAKVGVAGSNPVVRSRIGTSDQWQCDGPRTGASLVGPTKNQRNVRQLCPAAAGTGLVRAATRGQIAGRCRLDADHGARGESGQAGHLSYGQDEQPAERAATDPGPRPPQALPGEPVGSLEQWRRPRPPNGHVPSPLREKRRRRPDGATTPTAPAETASTGAG
jgi:hypothetical protein